MPDGFIQLPADSVGKKIDTSDLVVGASTSVHRERYVAADPTSATGLATVTSSGGLQVAITNPSTAVTITNTVRSLSSGTVTLSSNPTVVSASSGLVQISGTATIVSASSGLIQISGTPIVNIVGTSSAVAPVTSSGGMLATISAGTVTATAATNPWSSAPSFNVPMVSASSGLVQISGTATIVSASSGLVQAIVTGSSGVSAIVSSANSLQVATTQTPVNVTTSGSLLVMLSTNMLIPGGNLSVVSASSGLVQISGSPLVLTASSGYITRALSTDNIIALVTSSQGYAPVTTSFGVRTVPVSAYTSASVITASTVSKISSAAGTLWSIVALTTVTSSGGGGAYMRIYDLTTGNATSSGSMGSTSASMLLRLLSSTPDMPYEEAYYWPQGVRFGTACSFDIVTNATSTAGATLGGWVTAQYSA